MRGRDASVRAGHGRLLVFVCGNLRFPERLVKAARQPRIVLQVVPSGVGAHAGLDGHFVLASLMGRPTSCT